MILNVSFTGKYRYIYETNTKTVIALSDKQWEISVSYAERPRTTYLTDGAPRKINLGGGRRIEFLHTSEMRIFEFRNRKMQLLANAMRALGCENIGPADEETVKWHLESVPAEDFKSDLQLCPEWVRDILIDLKAS